MIEPTTPALAVFGGGLWLLNKILGPSVHLLGEDLRDQFAGYLGTNRKTVLEEAAAQVSASGVEAHDVPLRILLPLMERAGLEDQPAMQERWASLLANAATAKEPDAFPPYFVSILAQLSPVEARVLSILGLTTPHSGAVYKVKGAYSEGPGLSFRPHELEMELTSLPTDRVRLAVDALIGQGLASRNIIVEREPTDAEKVLMPAKVDVPFRSRSRRAEEPQIRITELGQKFLAACTPPNPSTERPSS